MDTSKEACEDTRNKVIVLSEALDGAGRILVETKNALGEMDSHVMPAPEVASALRALLAERDALREALRFYADEGFDGYDVEITDYGISMSVGEIIKDGGDRARAALAREGEG